MRRFILGLATSLAIFVCGCSSGWRSKDELGRRLYVKWPAPPTEMDKIEGNYVAMLADKRPDGLFMFSVGVQEHGEGMTDEEAAKVVDVLIQLLGEEISRKPLEFGKKKFPGVDATLRGRRGEIVRNMVVRSKTRIYSVTASVPNEEALSNRDVVKFFDSLKIDD